MFSFDGTPLPSNDRRLNKFLVQRSSGFSDDEIQWIREMQEELPRKRVGVGDDYDNRTLVDAVGCRIPLEDETLWLYSRLGELARSINGDNFGYELRGLETLCFIRYKPGQHFNWHCDSGGGSPYPRKLSLVVQLSDPSEYDGGDFEVMVGSCGEVRAQRVKGLVSAFSAYQQHRVTPVTKGVRDVLSVFAVGPHFR